VEARVVKPKLIFGALAVLVLGVFIPSASAQQPTKPLKVGVVMSPEGVEGDVQNALLPMIASNPNLQLVSDTSWDVNLLVNCLAPMQDGSGAACSEVVIYAPDSWMGLQIYLNSVVIVSQTPQTTAQYAYTMLLKSVTPDRLTAADTRLATTLQGVTAAVVQYQKTHPSESEALAKKESAKPKVPPTGTKDVKTL
jgi:hypothetical protein